MAAPEKRSPAGLKLIVFARLYHKQGGYVVRMNEESSRARIDRAQAEGQISSFQALDQRLMLEQLISMLGKAPPLHGDFEDRAAA